MVVTVEMSNSLVNLRVVFVIHVKWLQPVTLKYIGFIPVTGLLVTYYSGNPNHHA